MRSRFLPEKGVLMPGNSLTGRKFPYVSKDPVVNEFTKPLDELFFETIYLYHIPGIDWFGPYGRFLLKTSIFKGFDVQPSSSTYAITRTSGPSTVTAKSLDLTDPFKPLELQESVGVFAQPLREKKITFEARVGFGAREVFADEQLVLADDSTTASIEIAELRNIYQAGSDLFATAHGEIFTGVSYKVWGQLLTPFFNNQASGDNRGPIELTTIDLGASLGIKMAEWASLTYDLKALKDPQLLDKFQITHALLLNIAYTIIPSKAGK